MTLRACFLLAAVLVAAPRSADACSCMFGSPIVLPADGATGVPLDTRVWVGSQWNTDDGTGEAGFAETELLGPDGARVPGSMTGIVSRQDGLSVFTPDAPLAPNTRYTVRVEAGGLESTFTTGEARSAGAPGVPEAEVLETEVDPNREESACGPVAVALLRVRHDGVLALADREGSATYDPARADGSVTGLTEEDTFSLGTSLCLHTWPEADEGASTEVRFAAVDLAGNFSGWSAPVEVDLGGCGCGAAPGGAGLLGLVALARLRRRR